MTEPTTTTTSPSPAEAKSNPLANLPAPALQAIFLGVFAILVFLTVVCAWSVPNAAFSDVDLIHLSLKRLGKITAQLALLLLMTQFALSVRLSILDKAFGLDRLLLWHRYLGATAAVLAFCHPFLLYATPYYAMGSFEAVSHWPELVGAASLTLIWIIVLTSAFRAFLELPYHYWRRLHQLSFLAVIAALAHGIFRGSDLSKAGPLIFWITLFTAYIALFIWAKFVRRRRLAANPFTVTDVNPLNHNITEVTLAEPIGANLEFTAGQFAFITPAQSRLPHRRHPFTIASSPAESNHLRFTIRAVGPFTQRIGELQTGDKVLVEGPYGQFSYSHYHGRSLLLIAGGVGITPFISMLRHMAEANHKKPTTLIWVNRTKEDIVFFDELNQLSQDWPSTGAEHVKLRVHHVLTRQPDWPGETGRPDAAMLRRLITEQERTADVFLCGPPALMADMQRILPQLGIKKKHIHTEAFSLA